MRGALASDATVMTHCATKLFVRVAVKMPGLMLA